MNSLPVELTFGEQETAHTFVGKNASWHKRCHQKFNSSMLEHSKQKLSRKRKCSKSNESEHDCLPKRQTTGTQLTVCIICESETSEKLHEITTFNMDKSVKDWQGRCDSKLLVKLSGGVDLVLIEGKYHLMCLTKFRNCYRAFQHAQKDSPSLSNSM